jgi:anthranilate synthase component 1
MVTKDSIAYLQAGGGIVFDSVEYDEYIETINKLGANVKTIETAEKLHWEMQQQQQDGSSNGESGHSLPVRGKEVPGGKAHIDLAAG